MPYQLPIAQWHQIASRWFSDPAEHGRARYYPCIGPFLLLLWLCLVVAGNFGKTHTMLKLVSVARQSGLFLVLSLFTVAAISQEKKVAVAPPALQTEIAKMDSLLFGAYNARNPGLLKTFFTHDLEWYQDNGGLLDLKTVMENFEGIFKRDYVLTRTLVAGSMDVHPIKDYGAIQTGSHQFSHTENGKLEVGTFKFLMIWKKGEKGWQVSRVVSYDH